MNRNHTLVTMDAIEKLLDRKLDEKLQPIKDDLENVRDDLVNVKHVVEHRVYKEMKDGFARVEEITTAIVEDYSYHESRIRQLEAAA